MTPESPAVSPPSVQEVTQLIGAHEPWNLPQMLDRGFDLESRDHEGRTVIMWAALYGSLPAVKILIERSANVNAQDENGQTALHLAAGVAHSFRGEIARYLLASGAKADILNNAGESIFDIACRHNRADVVEAIEESVRAAADKAAREAEERRSAALLQQRQAAMQMLRARSRPLAFRPGRGP